LYVGLGGWEWCAGRVGPPSAPFCRVVDRVKLPCSSGSGPGTPRMRRSAVEEHLAGSQLGDLAGQAEAPHGLGEVAVVPHVGLVDERAGHGHLATEGPG